MTQEEMDKKCQDAFDTITVHLLRQGKKSMGHNDERCAYRGVDGAKCAIGAIIPDKKYDSSMERHAVSVVLRADASKFTLTKFLEGIGASENGKYTKLGHVLQRLQIVHDRMRVHIWNDEFQKIAVAYGLSTTAMTNFLSERNNSENTRTDAGAV